MSRRRGIVLDLFAVGAFALGVTGRRRARREAAVLDALKAGHRYGLDISKASGLRGGTMYPVLVRLEDRGAVASRFEDGPWPRRRVYRLVGEA